MKKKLTPEIRKAFALSALAGATKASASTGSPKLTALGIQIDKAMKVFSSKSRAEYWKISDDIGVLWEDVSKKYENTLETEEVEVFIELILGLLPPSRMKTFLCFSFSTKMNIRDEKKEEVMTTIWYIDKKLNSLFGTKQTATVESMARIMVKPEKSKKIKKKRDAPSCSPLIKGLRNRIAWQKKKNREDKEKEASV